VRCPWRAPLYLRNDCRRPPPSRNCWPCCRRSIPYRRCCSRGRRDGAVVAWRHRQHLSAALVNDEGVLKLCGRARRGGGAEGSEAGGMAEGDDS
jgi:hypothetical protein